ncbi:MULTISPECIES: hypothetical protein [Pseudomonas]|uniref:hypothetical protein n=1 Tax=Pseudomonas TaxID=286 RepID=UPI00049A5183|nr:MULTISPECIES: hypothetical protein [Pseudomonas]AHZ77243.1 hypothetical protein DW66_2732 [Pseudomonas putida]KGK25553.1 hypothetical protein GT93_12215 [Pseudomonas plecoglossicida]MBO2889557.1 hypothetical protein [Pseudomonas asiatica]QUN70166.1 hypothetical protein KDB76_13140 [Pseudomonas sp. JS425]
MSETNETLASLRSSIEALHSFSVTLQMMLSSKAEASFVSELASRVTACEGRVATCGSQVAAQGALIAAQGHAITPPWPRITSEDSAKVNADNALATPFVVVDGQTFICQAAIDSLLYVKDPDRLKVKLSINEQGQYVAAGIGIGVQDAEQPKQPSVTDLLDQIKAQLSESQLATELESRIALIEQSDAAIAERLTELSVKVDLVLRGMAGKGDAASI